MICRGCKHAVIGRTKSDLEMAKLGYRTCALAREGMERATYRRGSNPCDYPKRREAAK